MEENANCIATVKTATYQNIISKTFLVSHVSLHAICCS